MVKPDERIQTIAEEIHVVRTGLYGDTEMPGFQGDIPEMKAHLIKLNGSVEKAASQADINRAAIQVLHDRWKWLRVMASFSAGAVLTIMAWVISIYI